MSNGNSEDLKTIVDFAMTSSAFQQDVKTGTTGQNGTIASAVRLALDWPSSETVPEGWITALQAFSDSPPTSEAPSESLVNLGSAFGTTVLSN